MEEESVGNSLADSHDARTACALRGTRNSPSGLFHSSIFYESACVPCTNIRTSSRRWLHLFTVQKGKGFLPFTSASFCTRSHQRLLFGFRFASRTHMQTLKREKIQSEYTSCSGDQDDLIYSTPPTHLLLLLLLLLLLPSLGDHALTTNE